MIIMIIKLLFNKIYVLLQEFINYFYLSCITSGVLVNL